MIELSLHTYLILASLIFIIGIFGVLFNRNNIILILVSIELMLLAVNINFVTFSYYLQDLAGQIFSLFILTIAAAEVSIGLAIVVIQFRNSKSIFVEDINELRG